MFLLFNIYFILLNISKPLLGELGAVTFGGIAGYSSGYAIKKVFKVLLVLFGLLFVILQVLTHYEVVVVNWAKIQQLFNTFISGNDGMESAKQILMANLPTGGGFLAGFILGLKKG